MEDEGKMNDSGTSHKLLLTLDFREAGPILLSKGIIRYGSGSEVIEVFAVTGEGAHSLTFRNHCKNRLPWREFG